MSPKRRTLSSLVFACICLSKSLLIRIQKTISEFHKSHDTGLFFCVFYFFICFLFFFFFFFFFLVLFLFCFFCFFFFFGGGGAICIKTMDIQFTEARENN